VCALIHEKDSNPSRPQDEASTAPKSSLMYFKARLELTIDERAVASPPIACSRPLLNDKKDECSCEGDRPAILQLTRSNLRRHHQQISEGNNNGKQYPLVLRTSASVTASTIGKPSRSLILCNGILYTGWKH
jgi:hypothetical protein